MLSFNDLKNANNTSSYFMFFTPTPQTPLKQVRGGFWLESPFASEGGDS